VQDVEAAVGKDDLFPSGFEPGNSGFHWFDFFNLFIGHGKVPWALLGRSYHLQEGFATLQSPGRRGKLFIIKVDTFEPGVIWEKKWFLVLRKLILIILK